MNKPFQKAAPPISYAEGPRLSRALQSLPSAEQERMLKLAQDHLENPHIVSIQRNGKMISLVMEGSDAAQVFDFGAEMHAQRFLSALTDWLRANRASVKVLMPGS